MGGWRVREGEHMTMDDKTSRATRHRIEIKVSEEQKTTIARAAERSGVGVSEFVRRAAENAANAVLES